MNSTVGQITTLRFRQYRDSDKVMTQDVLVTAIGADGAITGHRIVKKTGQPEKGTGTWAGFIGGPAEFTVVG